MSGEGGGRTAGTAWLVFGLLWLALTGLCTAGFNRGFPGLFVLGLPVVAPGLLPLVLGLERLLNQRRAGQVIALIGGAWIAAVTTLFVADLMTGPDAASATSFLVAVLGAYAAPGALTLWRGVHLLSKAGRASHA
jgi:hypothetical protein